MNPNPIEYQNAARLPMTRYEFGIQVGQKTLLSSALGFTAGIVVWILAPLVLLFLLCGSISAVVLTRGRSACGWVGIGICLTFGLSGLIAWIIGG